MRYWWLRSPSNANTVSTICSSTRGPAIVPSLVTWPTSINADPRSLAKRISSCADARTWLTVPGAPSIKSLCIVWIESITSKAGGAPFPMVVNMSRTEVAAANCTGASPSPSRRARKRTWSTASSPEIYATLSPRRARLAAACSSKVDLPMPGSPPSKVAEPGTRPPPSARSNSAIPVEARSGSLMSVFSPDSSTERPPECK